MTWRSNPVLGTNALKIETFVSIFAFVRRSYVFAIHNAKTSEPGQEVLNERSEFRNLRLMNWPKDLKTLRDTLRAERNQNI